MFKIPLLSLLLFPITCLAQFTISGRVLNQVDTKPVANASAILSGATIGGKTDDNGTFLLKNVTPGKYDMVISIVGFETYTQTIFVNNADITLPDMVIFPKSTTLKRVTIKVDRNREKNLAQYYNLFKNQFLGTSDFAADCKILNPEMLDFEFDDKTNTLKASSEDFLQIENNALGYKVNYLLTKFEYNQDTKEFSYEGHTLFSAMAGSKSQERQWAQNRKIAYDGSTMQFLRSVLNDRLDENGFRVFQIATYQNPRRPGDSLIRARIDQYTKYEDKDSLNVWKKKANLQKMIREISPRPFTKADLILNTSQPGIFAFSSGKSQLRFKYDKKLLVMYDKTRRFINAKNLLDSVNLNFILSKGNSEGLTLLTFKDSVVFFDFNGRVSDPNDVLYFGAWSKKRVADLLPVDYRAEEDKFVPADSIITHLKNEISNYSTKHNFEKIHLHLDRPRYGIGDTIWFKAYALAGSDHLPSGSSGVMYTELFNENDSLLTRLILPLDSGISKGDFTIPSTYKAGNYRIRAYTNWMRNDSDYYFDQSVNIGGLPPASDIAVKIPSSKLQSANLQSTPAGPDLQFFPEGGDLINGLRSKVAFKVTGTDGHAKEIQGVIIDEAGNEVAELQTQYLGMGQFPLTPQTGKQYKAKITFKDSSTLIYKLPDAKEKGFVLTVNNATDSVYIKVAANDLLFNNKPDTSFYLIGQSAGKVCYASKTRLENKVFTTRIEKSRFPSGIVQFTLFSQNGEPLNERIIFIQNSDHLKLDVSLPGKTFAPLSKVKIDLNALNQDSKPIAGSFSISVTDESKAPVDEVSENTIFTDLLLTSELKGHIENPNYYFTDPSDKTRSDLDLLMLTQGYRRFDWKKILKDGNTHLKYPSEQSLSLSGTITTPGGKPIAHGKVRLTSIINRLAIDTISDTNGRFTFTNINLEDTTKVIINAKKANGGDNIKISINKQSFPSVDKVLKPLPEINGATSETVIAAMKQTYSEGSHISLKNTVLLNEVKIKSKRNDHFNPVYSDNMKYSTNLNGPGNANEVILGDKLIGCVSLAECLQGKILGVTWINGLPYSTRASTRHISGAKPMAVFIDGMQRGPADISLVDPNNVYSIEVLTSVAYLSVYGSNAPNGALIITMKRGSDYKAQDAAIDGLITYKINGFYKARSFYSPKYTPVDTHLANDDRKTIYWNPDIVTDANGKALLEYFNMGIKGGYRIVVEGIDGFGNPGRQVLRYTVE